jgi:RND family efflux transporter MFP subunit
MTLAKTNLTELLEITGPVRPVRGTDVSAEEAGTVAAIPHDKGQRVAAEAVLVELDRRLLKAEMEAARANLALQEYNYEKTQELFDAGKVSRQELLAAEAGDAQARSASRIAELRWERAAIKAPFAGLVADRYVEPGQLVAPGVPVVRVIDPFTLKLVGTVTEREVGWVRQGAPAEVTLDGHAEPVSGTVAWVGFEADPVNGKFKVEIHLDNTDLALRGGVVGRAQLPKQSHEGVLTVPRDALVTTPTGPAVFVVQADSTAAIRPVVLGADQGLMVTVTDGLQAGDRLVVRGQRDLVDGARVLITEEATAQDGSNGTDPGVVKMEHAAPRSARSQGGGA